MGQTVVGLFDSAADARKAQAELISRGFTQDHIDLSTQPESTTVSNRNTDRDDHRDETAVGRFFRNLFGDSDDDAEKYTRVASRNCSVVTVHAADRDEAERAADILDDCGAVDVDERASQYGYTADRTAVSDNLSSRDEVSRDSSASIPVIEENLRVSKQEEESGRVRVRSRVVEQPVSEEVRLREEQVTVERTAVDRPASDSDFEAFREGTIEMTERREVPVVSKEARVVEEVSLDKKVEERTETVRDTVRRTEVDVDRDDTTSDTTRRRDDDLSGNTLRTDSYSSDNTLRTGSDEDLSDEEYPRRRESGL